MLLCFVVFCLKCEVWSVREWWVGSVSVVVVCVLCVWFEYVEEK